MRTFVTVFFFFATLACNSQTDLHVLFSRGTLPAWVNTSPSMNLIATKTAKQKAGWKMEQNSAKSLSDANAAQYSYLRSGALLFNDEAGVLANSIVDQLLENDTAFRKTINLCVYYSSGTNMIAFPNGFIVIELGLFAQLENEHQLAFLIAHELAHVKNGDFATSEERWEPEEWSTDIERYVEYRKLRELKADEDGYQMYKLAGYSHYQAIRTFDVLERNWIVPQSLPFHTLLFTDSLFQYPASYLTETGKCSAGLSKSDFKRTTQEAYSIRSYELALEYKIDTASSEVINPSKEFTYVNRLAIYNSALIDLESQDYEAALYMGFYLHETDSSQRDESDLLIAKALYVGAALISTATEQDNTIESESIDRREKFGDLFFWANNPEPEKDVRGYIAGVHAFYSQLSPTERMILCMRWTWNYSQATVRHASIANELAGNSVMILNLQIDQPADSLGHIGTTYLWNKEHDIESDEDDDKKPNSDLERLKKMVLGMNPTLKEKLDSMEAQSKRRNGAAKSDNVSFTSPDVSTQLLSATHDPAFLSFYETYMVADSALKLKDKEVPEHMEADSVYLIGANHIWTREYKRTDIFRVNESKTDQVSKQIRKDVQTSAHANKVKLLSADPLEPDTVTLDDYNQYALSRRVFSELLGYKQERFAYPIVYKEEFDSIAEVNHVTYAITDLAVTKQFTKIRQPALWVAGLIFPYTTIIALTWVAVPRNFTYRQTAVYNLKTGNVDWTWVQTNKSSLVRNNRCRITQKCLRKSASQEEHLFVPRHSDRVQLVNVYL